MKIVLLVGNESRDIGHRLRETIDAVAPVNDGEVFDSVTNLVQGLKQRRGWVDVAILLADSKERLKELLSVNEQLETLRIVLILPDRDRDTVSDALLLRPRFLDYMDSDFSDIVAVLAKMRSRIVCN